MSALGALAGAAVSGLWKVAAIALLAILLMVGAGGGVALWLTDRARDKAAVDLDAERTASEALRTGIREQNRAVAALATATRAAQERGQAAQKVAAAAGQRYDASLQRLVGARATTCDEAMPAVNKLLEDVR